MVTFDNVFITKEMIDLSMSVSTITFGKLFMDSVRKCNNMHAFKANIINHILYIYRARSEIENNWLSPHVNLDKLFK